VSVEPGGNNADSPAAGGFRVDHSVKGLLGGGSRAGERPERRLGPPYQGPPRPIGRPWGGASPAGTRNYLVFRPPASRVPGWLGPIRGAQEQGPRTGQGAEAGHRPDIRATRGETETSWYNKPLVAVGRSVRTPAPKGLTEKNASGRTHRASRRAQGNGFLPTPVNLLPTHFPSFVSTFGWRGAIAGE